MRDPQIVHVGYGRREERMVEVDPARLLGGVTLSDILGHLDDRYDLTYIDRNDSFDNILETLQECIDKDNMCPLYEKTDDWWDDQSYESYREILRQLKETVVAHEFEDDIEGAWDTVTYNEQKHEGVDQIFEDYEDWIRDAIYDRDKSTPLSDCFRNTSELVLSYNAECDTINGWGNDLKHEMWLIKKALGIKKKDTRWDDPLWEMVSNANGGQLLFFFRGDAETWVSPMDKSINAITFKNPHLAIWDGMNGSGHDCQLKGFEITVPFTKLNLYIDKTRHYNYTYEVCGMSSDWCDGTEVTLGHKRYRRSK